MSTTFDIDGFKHLYTPFNEATLSVLPVYYAPEIEFVDPIHKLSGLNELTTYFRGFCNPDLPTHFIFLETLACPDHAFLRWQMRYSHPKLSSGNPLSLEGTSFIKFRDTVYFQQDFYDMNAMIYQHLPLVGSLTGFINNRLKSAI